MLPRWYGTSGELQLARLSHRSDVWEEARGILGSNTGDPRRASLIPCGLSQMDCDVSTSVGAPRRVGLRSRALGSRERPGESRRPAAAGGCDACVAAATSTCSRLDEAAP